MIDLVYKIVEVVSPVVSFVLITGLIIIICMVLLIIDLIRNWN